GTNHKLGGRIRRPPRPVNRRCAAPAGYARRRRTAQPATGRPTAASTNVAGSGTDGAGPAVGTGTTVSVMFVSTVPSDVGCVVAVKNESVCAPYCDSAQKFPSPIWPDGTVGPVYVHVKLSISGSSPGFTRSGVGPSLEMADVHPSG